MLPYSIMTGKAAGNEAATIGGTLETLQHVAHELKMIHNFLTGNEDEDW